MVHQFVCVEKVDDGMEQLHNAVANCNPVSVIKSFIICLVHMYLSNFYHLYHLGILRGNSSNLGLLVALSVVLVALVILVSFVVICSVAVFVFAKDRANLRMQLEVKAVIYEEIEGQSTSHVDTTENIAYTVSETV